jgi:hypothetical protein
MKNSQDHQVISVDGNEFRYAVAGSGNAVLLLQRVLNRALADQLAANFHVITIEVRESGRDLRVSKVLGKITNHLSISKYCLISGSELASPAIAHALEYSDSVEALVLVAPMSGASDGTSAELPLEEIKAPTLVLFGTRDQVAAPETGRIFARRIAKCFYTLVYDSGHDIAADRPQALGVVVRDFLQHREKFVVEHESSAINP